MPRVSPAYRLENSIYSRSSRIWALSNWIPSATSPALIITYCGAATRITVKKCSTDYSPKTVRCLNILPMMHRCSRWTFIRCGSGSFVGSKQKISRSDFYRSALRSGDMVAIKNRIAGEGPLSTHAFDTKIEGKKEMWARPPHKKALDHMWYAGELTTSHREKFTKFYDLSRTGHSCAAFANVDHPDDVQIDWLCRNALDRLAFGSPGDIQRFWGAISAVESKAWVNASKGSGSGGAGICRPAMVWRFCPIGH